MATITTKAPPGASAGPGPGLAPLWPQPIPVIGVTGEYGSGKTLFGLTISPGPTTLVYDLEKSSESYVSLGFERIDVPGKMLQRHPHGYKPIDTFLWWRDHMRSVPPGKYRVILVDPASDIESGLADWVRANPGHFGRTAAQYLKMSGLMWGDVKELWKSLLADLASRCECFVFSTHMGDTWVGDKATGKRKPKGKATLMELASLYLQMVRLPDPKGALPAKPSAIVLKSRLMHSSLTATGDLAIVPALPPRLPVATPAEIRSYMLSPPDPAKLTKDERYVEPGITDDERAETRLAIAQAEGDAERLRLERLQREQEIAEKRAAREAQAQPGPARSAPEPPQPVAEVLPAARPAPVPTTNGHGNGHAARPGPAPSQTKATSPPGEGEERATPEQLKQLASLRADLFRLTLPQGTDADKQAAWAAILAKRSVTTARDLTPFDAGKLIEALAHRVNLAEMERSLAGAGEDSPTDDAGGD